jgi:hypothetical protein
MIALRLRTATAALAVGALLTGVEAQAQSSSERYSLRGFGGWALGRTDNDNSYGYIADGETEYNNYNFALNVAAQPAERVSVRAQAFWGEDLRGKNLDLDYVFAQYAHSPKLKLRVGKVLSPLGLYTETYNVGTLRPFYLLPTFYSGTSGLLPQAYLGAGLTGVLPLGEKWELSYDAFGGEMRFQEVPSNVVGPPGENGAPTIQIVQLQLVGRDMLGGRLGLGLPDHGLEFGVAAMHATIQQQINGGPREPYPVTDKSTLANAYLKYARGPFALQAEFFKAFTDTTDLDSGYVEASYRLGRHWQLAALYEHSSLKPESGTLYASLPEQLKYDKTFGAALNFWVTSDVVFKLNGYSVKGNESARTDTAALDALTGRLDDHTLVLVLGAQFSF